MFFLISPPLPWGQGPACSSVGASWLLAPTYRAHLDLPKRDTNCPPPTLHGGSGWFSLPGFGFAEENTTGGPQGAGTGLTWERSQWQVGLLVMANANHDSIEDVGLTDTTSLSEHLPLARGREIRALSHTDNCCLAQKPNKTAVRDQRCACQRLGLPGAGWVPGELHVTSEAVKSHPAPFPWRWHWGGSPCWSSLI